MGTKMRMEKGEIALDGYGTRKSMYGRCGVRKVNGVYILRSYNVRQFAAAYKGRLVLAYTGEYSESATSLQHLSAFASFAGATYTGKTGTGKRDPFKYSNLATVKGGAFVSDEALALEVKRAVNAQLERESEQNATAKATA